MLVQIPNWDSLMFRVSSNVKMSPVAMLKIWELKMMKPEYWTRMLFFKGWGILLAPEIWVSYMHR